MVRSISLMPHAVCWRADPKLIWVMVVTNAITALSYLSICLTLFYLVRRTRQVIARDWGYFAVGFALFIVACGSTHLMEVVTTWWPWFWIDASANIITAALSAYVAAQFIRRVSTVGFSINDYAARLSRSEDERRQLLNSLLDSKKLEDWSRMSATVAHEIANPLESIQNLLYLIRSTPGVSAEVAALADTAVAESNRVITISRSTLSFFRQGSVPEPIDLRDAADSVSDLLHSVFHRSDVELRIEAADDLMVEALPGEPRQVLLNLIRNAYEAVGPVGAEVRLVLNGRLNGVEIAVADNGTGIPPAILPNLFQFGLSTKGDRGNGMGLWSVRQLLARHSGTIQVSSELDKGTTFTLWWPRRFPRPLPPSPVPVPESWKETVDAQSLFTISLRQYPPPPYFLV